MARTLGLFQTKGMRRNTPGNQPPGVTGMILETLSSNIKDGSAIAEGPSGRTGKGKGERWVGAESCKAKGGKGAAVGEAICLFKKR